MQGYMGYKIKQEVGTKHETNTNLTGTITRHLLAAKAMSGTHETNYSCRISLLFLILCSNCKLLEYISKCLNCKYEWTVRATHGKTSATKAMNGRPFMGKQVEALAFDLQGGWLRLI